MISASASPDRHDAGLPGLRLGRWLAAFALGLAALGLLAFATAGNGLPAPGSVRPGVAVMSAGMPAHGPAPALLKLERDGTAVAADIDLVADPALPGPTAIAITTRGFGVAAFREVRALPPAPAPDSSPLRPPRTA